MSKRDHRAKKTYKVLSFKGGKARKRSRINIAASLSTQNDTSLTTSHDSYDESFVADINPPSFTFGKENTSKFLKRRLRDYRQRKANLANSWRSFRHEALSSLIEESCLRSDQPCISPGCSELAVGKCSDCGPSSFLCKTHMDVVHFEGRTLHKPQLWKVYITPYNQILKPQSL